MVPRATWALRCAVLVVSGALLSGCAQPPDCPAEPGHLCIRALPRPDVFKFYRAEVRAGDTCQQLDALDSPVTGPGRFQAICPVQTAGQMQCDRSLVPTPSQNSNMLGCPDGSQAVTAGGVSLCPVPTRSQTIGTEITANIDLGGSSGPGTVRMFLFDANGVCLEAGVVPFTASRAKDMTVDLTLAADGCASLWHQQCATDVDCGGSQRAQICCNQRCIAPPAPPVASVQGGQRAMTFIPAGTMVMGDPNSGVQGEYPCCKISGQDCGTSPMPTISVGPLYMDVYEADVASYQAFLAANPGAANMPLSRPMAGYPATSMPFYCTYAAAAPAGDPMALQRAVNCVNFAQAQSYCSYRLQLDEPGVIGSAELPKESEWEWVAVGGRVLPLGQKPVVPWSADSGASVPTSCNGVGVNFADATGNPCDTPDAAHPPVRVPGASTGDRTPGGAVWPSPPIWDLAGNLSEWTATTLVDTSVMPGGFNYCAPENPATAPLSVIRGGNWAHVNTSLTTYHRDSRLNSIPPMETDISRLDQVGIRCVLRLRH